MRSIRWHKRVPLTGFTLLAVLCIVMLSGCQKSSDPVELTFTSWRIDDTDEMNAINNLFTEENCNITIRFDPYDPVDYDSITDKNMAAGDGADIFFLWSYDKGRRLFDNGYLYDLTSVIPDLEAYGEVPRNAWTSEDGKTYGLPSVGVTHGIYYNLALFNKHQIQEPANWDAFIAACEKLLAAGETVIAQGVADNFWTLNRVVFSGLGANFYGGEPSRQALMNGTKKLTDPAFVDAFEAVNSPKKYFPANYPSLGYEAAKRMFANGQAAMFIGGSWEISVFEGLGANQSSIGWFAPPVKKSGDRLQYCFEVDAAIGINKNSKHLDEAIKYLKWASGEEYAQAVMTKLPGFFTYTPGTFTLENPLAQKMLSLASTSDLTPRLMDQHFNSGTPRGEELLDEALLSMILGTMTPEQAAAWVQSRLNH